MAGEAFDCVREFHVVMEHPCNDTLQTNVWADNPKLAKLREKLIAEELGELMDAMANLDVVEIADALADSRYVIVGAFLALGIPVRDALVKAESSLGTFDKAKAIYSFPLPHKNKDPLGRCEKMQQFLDRYAIKFGAYYELITNVFTIQNFDLLTSALLSLAVDMKRFAWELGIDIDTIFREVHRSNMTKVCKTEEDAQKSVEKLAETGKCTTAAYKLSKCGNYYMIYNEKTGKALKGIHFELPQIAEFL